MARSIRTGKRDWIDVVLFILLTFWGLIIVVPFINVVAISFTSHKEYLETPLLIFPKEPEIKAYQELFKGGRILTGYRNTLFIIAVGVPLSLFLCSSMAYALSRRQFPGRRLVFFFVLFTMIFQGGIVPLYLVIRDLKLTNTLWSIILSSAMNTFYMILMYNYFSSLPESLVESARLDGAGDWTVLFKIILPLSLPMLATLTLFFTVDKWNEYFNALIFIRKSNLETLQIVLRSIVFDSMTGEQGSMALSGESKNRAFTMGIKMAAVMLTMIPVMCIYPFLQKHFVKGVLVGAIKA
jgi:putative aldouronate transport system permease protein